MPVTVQVQRHASTQHRRLVVELSKARQALLQAQGLLSQQGQQHEQEAHGTAAVGAPQPGTGSSRTDPQDRTAAVSSSSVRQQARPASPARQQRPPWQGAAAGSPAGGGDVVDTARDAAGRSPSPGSPGRAQPHVLAAVQQACLVEALRDRNQTLEERCCHLEQDLAAQLAASSAQHVHDLHAELHRCNEQLWEQLEVIGQLEAAVAASEVAADASGRRADAAVAMLRDAGLYGGAAGMGPAAKRPTSAAGAGARARGAGTRPATAPCSAQGALSARCHSARGGAASAAASAAAAARGQLRAASSLALQQAVQVYSSYPPQRAMKLVPQQRGSGTRPQSSPSRVQAVEQQVEAHCTPSLGGRLRGLQHSLRLCAEELPTVGDRCVTPVATACAAVEGPPTQGVLRDFIIASLL